MLSDLQGTSKAAARYQPNDVHEVRCACRATVLRSVCLIAVHSWTSTSAPWHRSGCQIHMRVLYLIDSLVPGGAEQSLASLAPFYTGAGVRLDVAYLHDRPGLQPSLQEAGAELFCLGSGRDRLRSIQLTRRLIAERAPDLIHTTLFEADLAGRTAGWLSRVPVVSSLVNLEYGPEQRSDPRLKGWKLRAAQAADAGTARAVHRFHAVSRSVADVMARRLLLPRRRIDVVPRGRDAKGLGRRTSDRRAAARGALGVDSTTSLVLAVARHEYQKGLDLLIEAFPRILHATPEARLLVVGREGGHTNALSQAIQRLQLNEAVLLLGARNDVPDLLCGADVFVAPSRWEGLPGAVLEAMALEAPIVASDIPSVREAVAEDSAVLVPSGDPVALADAVTATLRDPSAAAERARHARADFLERFTLEAVAAAMLSFYERALMRTRFRIP